MGVLADGVAGGPRFVASRRRIALPRVTSASLLPDADDRSRRRHVFPVSDTTRRVFKAHRPRGRIYARPVLISDKDCAY
jgi:hypothetical protein